jgi:hypothetical protein
VWLSPKAPSAGAESAKAPILVRLRWNGDCGRGRMLRLHFGGDFDRAIATQCLASAHRASPMTPQSRAETPSIWGRIIETTLPEERASRHGHRTVGGLKLADQSLDSLPWLTAYYWGILFSSLRHWFASRVRGQARAVWQLRTCRPCPVSFTNLASCGLWGRPPRRGRSRLNFVALLTKYSRKEQRQ